MIASPFTALVIGGSVGGLAAAHELRSIGAEVTVYERSVDRTQPRGAGIVMQPEVESLLGRLGRSVPSVSVLLRERQQLHRDGRLNRYDAPQWMTAWDTLYAALREPLPDGCYRLNSELASLRVDDDDVTAAFTAGHRGVGNFVVGADGVGSAVRSLLDIPGAVDLFGLRRLPWTRAGGRSAFAPGRTAGRALHHVRRSWPAAAVLPGAWRRR